MDAFWGGGFWDFFRDRSSHDIETLYPYPPDQTARFGVCLGLGLGLVCAHFLGFCGFSVLPASGCENGVFFSFSTRTIVLRTLKFQPDLLKWYDLLINTHVGICDIMCDWQVLTCGFMMAACTWAGARCLCLIVSFSFELPAVLRAERVFCHPHHSCSHTTIC